MKTNLNSSLILYDSANTPLSTHDDFTSNIDVEKFDEVLSIMEDFAVAADIVEGKFQKLTKQNFILGRTDAEIFSNILVEVISGDFYRVVYFEAIKQFCLLSNSYHNRINLTNPPNISFIIPVLHKSGKSVLARVKVLPFKRDRNGKLISICIIFSPAREYDNVPIPVHPKVSTKNYGGNGEVQDWTRKVKRRIASRIMEWLDLTKDEWDVLEYLLEDQTRAKIANFMECSAGKVRNLCRSIKRKAARKISPIFNQGQKSQAKDVAVFLKKMWVLGRKKQELGNY